MVRAQQREYLGTKLMVAAARVSDERRLLAVWEVDGRIEDAVDAAERVSR